MPGGEGSKRSLISILRGDFLVSVTFGIVRVSTPSLYSALISSSLTFSSVKERLARPERRSFMI